MMDNVFTAHDRCDQCGAQARVGLTKGKAELMFCGHDFTSNELALISAGWEVVADDRASLANA